MKDERKENETNEYGYMTANILRPDRQHLTIAPSWIRKSVRACWGACPAHARQDAQPAKLAEQAGK